MRKEIIIFGLILVLFLAGCENETENQTITGNSVGVDGGGVEIPLSDLSNEVQYYTFEDGGVEINYFAVLGSDGEPRTAFDACDVCGGYKGYQQNDNDITCRNCGRVFSINGLGSKNKGYGCWPSYLPHEVIGDSVFIKIDDITNGKFRFE